MEKNPHYFYIYGKGNACAPPHTLKTEGRGMSLVHQT